MRAAPSSSCSCSSDMPASTSSAGTSPASGSSTPDKFYGHKELAEFCEYVVADLFCLTSPLCETPPRSPEVSKKNPPKLAEFIAYAIYRTRLAGPIIHQALFYLQRLKARYPAARGTESSPHRLFLSALILSAKMSMDDCYSNKSWTIVGGNLFSLKEVNQMERELFGFLDYDLSCEHENLDGFVNDRLLDWESRKQASAGQVKFQLYYPSELLAQDRHCQHERRHTADDYIHFDGFSSSSEQIMSSSSSQQKHQVKKRRVSDPVFASAREQAQRHKRASDAAIALLRPDYKSSASYSTLQHLLKSKTSHQASYSCHSTPPSLSSGSASLAPSEVSTPYSPLSLQQNTSPDMSDACDDCERFPSQFKSPRTAAVLAAQ